MHPLALQDNHPLRIHASLSMGSHTLPPATSHADPPVVELVDLRKVFLPDVEAVAGVSLQVQPGELLVCLGPSGCGKTTLLRMIAGLEALTGGQVRFHGEDATALPAHARHVAMVMADAPLYPHWTVQRHLEEAVYQRIRRRRKERSRSQGLSSIAFCRPRSRRSVSRLVLGEAQRWSIEPLLARQARTLSSGERQRVALARAMLRRPQLLLLDEPFAHLDAHLRQELREMLRRQHASRPLAMVLVTHDQEEAFQLADRIAVLRQGRIEQCAAAEELWRRPATVFVAGTIGNPPHNLVEVELMAGNSGGTPVCIVRQNGRRIGEFAPRGGLDPMDVVAPIGETAPGLLQSLPRTAILAVHPRCIRLLHQGLQDASGETDALGLAVRPTRGRASIAVRILHARRTDPHALESVVRVAWLADPAIHWNIVVPVERGVDSPPTVGGEVELGFLWSDVHWFDIQTDKRLEHPLT